MLVEARDNVVDKAREKVLVEAREEVLGEAREEVLVEAREEVLGEAREEVLLEARQQSCHGHRSESSSLYFTTWATKVLYCQKVFITK